MIPPGWQKCSSDGNDNSNNDDGDGDDIDEDAYSALRQ